ncbi:hypothetical protein [Hydrotalea sp.]|uniref:hypothetical protein n=1 Tax=Hydrotalea sp. TaxID=2881279 RepID=UPI00261C78ED|nr:hypothetical protein [Hydrotalea sp.]
MRNPTLLFFPGFLFIQLLITFYSQTYLLTDDLYRLIVGSQMSDRQFEDYMEFVHKWQWVSYLFIPLALLLRISFAWVCLKAGSFVTDCFTQSSFWKICVQAEIVFAVGAVAGLLYTEFFVDVETLEQLSINPFSLQLFLSQSVPKWSNYFFNTLNLFELSYVLFLAYLLAAESKRMFLPSLRFVASTYLPGLALWVLLVSYLSVLFQP